MLHNDVTGWTDLDPDSRFRNSVPTTIITADEIANGEYDSLNGDVFQAGMTRKAVYKESDGTRWPVELVLYVHPVGAGALTIRTAGASTCRGRFLSEAGAFTGAASVKNVTVAGGLLTQYSETTSEIGSSTSREPVWSTSIAEGDAIWVVRKGRYEALSDAAVAAEIDVQLHNASGTGRVGPANTMLTPNAAEIRAALPTGEGSCIGTSETLAAGAAAYFNIHVNLPDRWQR